MKQDIDHMIAIQYRYLHRWTASDTACNTNDNMETLPLDHYLKHARLEGDPLEASSKEAHSSTGLNCINADQFALELYVPALIRAHSKQAGFGGTESCNTLFKTAVIAPFGLGLAEMTLSPDELKDYILHFTGWLAANQDKPIVLFHSRCEVSLHRLASRHSVELPDNLVIASIESQLPRRIRSLSLPYPVSYELHDADKYSEYLGNRAASSADSLQCGDLSRAIHFAGRNRNESSFYSRHRQRNACCAYADTSPFFLRSTIEVSKRRHLLTHQSNIRLSEARQRCYLSLEPPGDTPSRKGFYDSLVIGSIPIIFEDSLWNFPFDSQLDIGRVPFILSHNESVKLASGFTKGLHNFITAIPPRIQDHLHRLQHVATAMIICDPRSPDSAGSRYWQILTNELQQRLGRCRSGNQVLS